jgi:hypothetical protein
MIGYKLVDQNMQTKGNFQWKLGETRTVKSSFKLQPLCSEYWLHFYVDPRLAIIMNPHGAAFKDPLLFRCRPEGKIRHDKGKLKSGCTKMTLVEALPIPNITSIQKIAFGIYASLEVYTDPTYFKWANNWISDVNRDYNAAAAANAATYATAAAAYHAVNTAYAAVNTAYATAAAANYAANAAKYAAANAAYYAANAANYAANAANYANAAAANYAANAGYAAYAATNAAYAANTNINLITLIDKAMLIK